MQTTSENRCFGGRNLVMTHAAAATGCEMTLGVYLPPQAAEGPVPVLWYLSGLTCTHENAMVKAGAQAAAAAHGIAVVFPDTSPRGSEAADEDAYDLGQGAGFYVDATEPPWSAHYGMETYIADELPAALFAALPLDRARQGITGHSMGGHGALTLAMKRPRQWRSLSAFAPIANPAASDWGRKQFAAYLGADETRWESHDATLLMRAHGWPGEILIDQGAADQFLDLLMPEALAGAMAARRQPGAVRMQAGYDHSYFFVASFMAEHVAFHAARLRE